MIVRMNESFLVCLFLKFPVHITHLQAEMDASVTVSLLLLNLLNNLVFASLLNDRRTLLEAFKRVKIRHAFREGNRLCR